MNQHADETQLLAPSAPAASQRLVQPSHREGSTCTPRAFDSETPLADSEDDLMDWAGNFAEADDAALGKMLKERIAKRHRPY